MMTVTVAADVLRAALLFTKSDPVYGSTLRDEYQHVILDRTIVATDGHTMFVANPGEVLIEGAARPVLLHRGFVEHIAKGDEAVTFMVGKQAMDGEGNLYPLPAGEIVNWRKIYPRTTNGGASQYNLLYLNRIIQANIELGARADLTAGIVHVYHNGTAGPAVAELHNRRGHVLCNHRLDNSCDTFTPFNL